MNIFCDWTFNKSNFKGRFILVLFRIAHLAKLNVLFFVLLSPYLIIYRFFVEWILCVELPYKTEIGTGMVLFHGQGLVINDKTIIGKNCTIRHCVTVGNKRLSDGSYSSCPVIGDNVDIGSNVCIIGSVKIGDNVKIGAGAVVVRDVPSNCIIAGNPARILQVIQS